MRRFPSGGLKLDMQTKTQRHKHLEHRREARVSFLRQRLVKTFAADPGGARGLGHPARTCHIADRLGDERRIVTSILEYRFEVQHAFLGRLQVILNIPGCRFECHFHNSFTMACAAAMSLLCGDLWPPTSSTTSVSPRWVQYSRYPGPKSIFSPNTPPASLAMLS